VAGEKKEMIRTEPIRRLKKEKHQHFVWEKINTMFVINGVYRI